MAWLSQKNATSVFTAKNVNTRIRYTPTHCIHRRIHFSTCRASFQTNRILAATSLTALQIPKEATVAKLFIALETRIAAYDQPWLYWYYGRWYCSVVLRLTDDGHTSCQYSASAHSKSKGRVGQQRRYPKAEAAATAAIDRTTTSTSTHRRCSRPRQRRCAVRDQKDPASRCSRSSGDRNILHQQKQS